MSTRAVVALPGMLCDGRLWAQPGFDLGPDVTLHPTPLCGSTMDEMVRDVLALPYAEMTLLALSLGGILAMAVAAAAPERVAGLAVLSATARPPRPEQHESWDQMAALTAAGGFEAITPELLVPVLVRDGHGAHPALRGTVAAMAVSVGPDRFLEQLSAQHSRVDLRPTLPGIGCPVLVCAGEHDALVRVDAMREIADTVPDGRLEVIGGAGHLSPLEEPAEVARHLRAWLARL